MRSPSCTTPFINHPKTCNLFSIPTTLWYKASPMMCRCKSRCMERLCSLFSIENVLWLWRSWVACRCPWTCEQPIVSALQFNPSVLLPVITHTFCICILWFMIICTSVFLYFFSSVHQPQMADGPWREVGGCQEQWQPTHHSPALSALWFEGWVGGGWVVHWCWWTCTCTRGGAGAALNTLTKHTYGPRGCEKG